MNKKYIFILIIASTLLSTLLITNNIIGQRLASTANEQVQQILNEQSELSSFNIEYDEITASPINGSLTIHGFEALDSIGNYGLSADRIKISLPLSELLSLKDDKSIYSFEKISFTLVDPKIIYPNDVTRLLGESIKLTFDGELPFSQIKKIDDGLLPTTRQSVKVEAKNIYWWNINEINNELADSYQEALNNISQSPVSLSFGAAFIPDEKRLAFNDWEIETTNSKLNGLAELRFSGENINDFELSGLTMESEYDLSLSKSLDPEFVDLSIGRMQGRFLIDVELDNIIDLIQTDNFIEESPIKNFELDFKIEDFNLSTTEKLGYSLSKFGISLIQEELFVDELSFKLRKQNQGLNINDINLELKDFIRLDANAVLVYKTEAMSSLLLQRKTEVLTFKNAQVYLKPFSDEAEELIQKWEKNKSNILIKKRGKYRFQLTGPVINPIVNDLNN